MTGRRRSALAVTGARADLAKAVRRIRDESGMTLRQVAERSGYAQATLSMVESGRRIPSWDLLTAFVQSCGADPAEVREFWRIAAEPDSAQPQGEVVSAVLAPTAVQPIRPPLGRVAQLPADVAGFTGRDAELAELDRLLTSRDQGSEPTAMMIAAVSGMAGVGKTALATRWAHQRRSHFPDGQLYVNLRGYDPEQPVGAVDALAGFLAALGVAGQAVPMTAADMSGRFRSEMAGRRMLVVLDNAASADQVRPLLPGSASCAVVVTSRDSLTGFVALHGARRIQLDPLPQAQAVALLGRVLGHQVTAEPAAAAALARLCAGLPLALRVAAELAAGRSETPLSDLVAELSGLRRRLDALDGDGDSRAALRTVFSWSLRSLPAGAARLFALLGLHPGTLFDDYAAAALADISLEDARRRLGRLARAHLIEPAARERYTMHDLLRDYAAELANTPAAAVEPRASLGRLLDYYLATAATAMDRLHPAEERLRPRVPPAVTPTPELPDPQTALKWLDSERPNIVAVSEHAAAHGWPSHAVRLSGTLHRYLDGGHFTAGLIVHGKACEAARQAGDQEGEASSLHRLATVQWHLGQRTQAADHLHRALALHRQAGDRLAEAAALGDLGVMEWSLGHHSSSIWHHEQALALFAQSGDQTGEALTMNNLGDALRRFGRHREGTNYLHRALKLSRQIGARYCEALSLSSIGEAEQDASRPEQAADYFLQALAVYQQLGNQAREAVTLINIGASYATLNRPVQAAEFYERGLALFREADDRDGEANALNGLGEAALAADCPKQALIHHKAVLALALGGDSLNQQARAHVGVARAYSALGQQNCAREHLECAVTLYSDLDSPDAERARNLLAGQTAQSVGSRTRTDSAD